MSNLLTIENKRFEFQRATAAIEQQETPVLMNNMAEGQKIHLLCYAQQKLNMPMLYLAKDEYEATAALKNAKAFGQEGVYYYPPRDIVYYPVAGRSYEWEHMRIETIGALKEKKATVVVTTIGAVMQFLPAQKSFYAHFFTLKQGQQVDIETLCRQLVEGGYVHSETIEGIGQFSRRGYILDIFSPMYKDPLRIEFFDNEIDTISTFDVFSQRRQDTLKQAQIAPAKEQLLEGKEKTAALLESLIRRAKASKRENKEEIATDLQKDLERVKEGIELLNFDRYLSLLYEPDSLFEYFTQPFGVLVSDYKAIKKKSEDVLWQNTEDVKELLVKTVGYGKTHHFLWDFTSIITKAQNNNLIIAENFNNTSFEVPIRTIITLMGKGLSPFSTKDFLLEEVGYYKEKKYSTVVCVASVQRAERLQSILQEANILAPIVKEVKTLVQGQVLLYISDNKYSMEYESIGLAILAEKRNGEHKGKTGVVRTGKKEKKKAPLFYNDLKPGDFVVHTNYGIGKFVGIEKIEVEKTIKDYIKISFAGSDTLFVPCNQLDLISKYVGNESKRVKLSKMGGGEWAKTKAKVKAAAKEMAKELIDLYAARQKIKGYAFPQDDELQFDFEGKFPYDETDDQLRSAEEIKRDMEKDMPMDRLLCGDVGFGKTEVAMRGIFKCVNGGKQAAVLVPTTLLAMQHYATMRERFEGYPVNIEVLSRFRTKKQQEEILKEVKRGTVDIVIGTHRIIQKDVKFKDLGLLVVDEEQRFGVLHKEKLKEMTKHVHCLTLSATPIPRTLNMAMSGIRDMSLIDEPPKDRQPVATYVCAYNSGIVQDAIGKELRRGGQVFYLFNNVEHIGEEAAKIQRLVPSANVVFAHGKMAEEEISSVMNRFLNREADVLVCTTIIETGIDIQNANTLVITNADRLGLSQLYQIRGRVGRSSRRAYAYLTYEENKVLNEDAVKRLMAIKEYTEFGSGFKIAMRDLQIRGAGNILGTSQHGHMENVGYDMYLKLLNEAVLEENGQEKEIPVSCSVDLFVNAYIPEQYVKSGETRIELYKKIAAVTNEEDALDIKDEMIDRFGDIPKSVNSLVDIAMLRNRASACLIKEISQKGNRIFVYPTDMTIDIMTGLTKAYNRDINFLTGKEMGFVVTKKEEETGEEAIKKLLHLYENHA